MADSIFDVRWIHGANCGANGDPPFQVHKLDEDTFVLRQSKCVTFEGNFIYLLFGTQKAILLDTSAHPDRQPAPPPPIRRTVQDVIARRQETQSAGITELIVGHAHGHGDHAFGDSQFRGRANTRLVEATLFDVKKELHLPDWPNGRATIDLGGRELVILRLPGHEESHIAVYDPKAQLLLTGDALYPGKLTVEKWSDYRNSAARLATFVSAHPVSLVLGAHIEMKNAPRELSPVPTFVQQDEHALPLGVQHVHEWHRACEAMSDSPKVDVHDDFVISPDE
jgi:hydroxyacylglutathione hydrolase